MKKTLTIFICFLICILPFSFSASAAVTAITSPLHDPQPSIVDNGSTGYDYKVFFVAQYSDTGTFLYEMDFTLPYTANIKLILKNPNQWFLWCSQSINYTQITYDVSDGSFDEQHYGTGLNDIVSPDPALPYYMNARAGYFPARSVYNHTLLGAYYIMPEGITVEILNNNYLVEPFVTWAPDLPFVHTYKSYTSEPVCDELNRYFILAGEDQSYLYVIHYFLSEAVTFENNTVVAAPGSVETSYQFNVKNLFCPYVDLTNSGFELSINCDSDMLQLINANGSHIITYDLQVAQYNLLDGQYIASYVFTDLVLTQNKIPLNVNLGDPEDYDSAKFYGVFYQDTSTSYHLNFLACTFSIDPDFEVWKEQVNQYLELIYQALTESEEEPATIADDMSAYDEMQSAKDALQVTDENGSEIDAAEQVEIAFSEAASGMADISDGVQSVNGLISDLFLVHPYVIIPLIVALALGLVVTILGKNKSD